ncbi:MAG: hypothetical protein ACREBI_12320 [Nitrosotalea sp.]
MMSIRESVLQHSKIHHELFYNRSRLIMTHGITEFIDYIKQRHDTARAVCESTANYWFRLHYTLEEN